METQNKTLTEQIDKLIAERLALKIPHTCMTCDWFQLNTKGLRNRNCMNPKDLTEKDFVKGVCQQWRLATDLSVRQPRNLTV